MKPLTIDDMYVEQVRSARRQPIEEKFLAGIRLFSFACELARSDIRAKHPDADDQRVKELLRSRLALARRLEDGY